MYSSICIRNVLKSRMKIKAKTKLRKLKAQELFDILQVEHRT